jgi:hypothetical protein
MKFWYLALSLCSFYILTSCERSVKLDGSSEEKLKASVERAKKDLSPQQREEFESAAALLTLHDKNILQAAADPEAFKRSMLDRLNGKTAEEVIKEADVIRTGRQASERSQITSEIVELEAKKAAAETAAKSLSKFAIQRSRFSFEDNGFMATPQIEVTVMNGLNAAISRVYFQGILATPGRSVPWVSDGFNYSIPGGLEPGETATWKLSPNQFGEWGKAPKDRTDMVLTLKVVKINGPDGKTLIDGEFSDEDTQRLDKLRGLSR